MLNFFHFSGFILADDMLVTDQVSKIGFRQKMG